MIDIEQGPQVSLRYDTGALSFSNQTNILSTRQLYIVFSALSLALSVSFIEKTSVSASVLAISADINSGSATSWVGGSFLIASIGFQLLNGKLSDIFGRKNCLLGMFGASSSWGSYYVDSSQIAIMLYIFRAAVCMQDFDV
jgi:MFS family permease